MIIRHELRQGKLSLAVWTVAISFLLVVCIFLFPEMKKEMDSINEVFSSMGGFSQAFGMDQISFGTLTGFYAVECGNILGLGGAFFAALCAVTVLAKEEKDHTAEFLLSHPVTRSSIVTGKFIAVLIQIVLLNSTIFVLAASSVALTGETVPWKELTLLHLAYFLVQLEIAGICFGISAFIRRGGMGMGLGVAVIMYFLHLVANITESAQALDIITPFGYADGPSIVSEAGLDGAKILFGMALGALGAAAGYFKYCRKDIGV